MSASDECRCKACRDDLLVERAKTHGSFEVNARISQELKMVFARHGAADLSAVHREVLDMIATKVARILSGNAGYRDHWDDIAGYGQLAAAECDEA